MAEDEGVLRVIPETPYRLLGDKRVTPQMKHLLVAAMSTFEGVEFAVYMQGAVDMLILSQRHPELAFAMGADILRDKREQKVLGEAVGEPPEELEARIDNLAVRNTFDYESTVQRVPVELLDKEGKPN